MTCSPFDLRDYFFGELSPAERSVTETHIAGCLSCREELAKLSDVRTLLLSSMPDEEPPRRIAFVSDKVFEPRWWQKLWASGPQLGFAGAALLAAAIIVHGFLARPVVSAPAPLTASVPAPVAVSAPAPAPAMDKAVMQAEIEHRVQAEVEKAVAARESEQLGRVLEVVNTRLHRVENRNSRDLLLIREYLERQAKLNAVQTRRAVYE
jgi:anti-sigma factor RsiW